jgi:histone-lysine N-methyltransferase SETMAR
LNEKPRSGRPVTATDKSRQDRVDELIRENRRIKQKEIAEALGISKERVEHIISILGYGKVCARWVPRMLTDNMSVEKVRVSQELLQRFENEGNEFLYRIITGDETWEHHIGTRSHDNRRNSKLKPQLAR